MCVAHLTFSLESLLLIPGWKVAICRKGFPSRALSEVLLQSEYLVEKNNKVRPQVRKMTSKHHGV